MHVRADFLADYERILRVELEAAGYRVPANADVALLYFNVLRRMVHPAARRVHEAPSLECPPEWKEKFELLKEKIRSGANLVPHQSRKLVKKKRAAANDGMLNDWDIQHLHLGTDEEAPGVIEGTEYVLYGRFTDTDAYLLAVLPHDHWTDRSLVELLCRTWPETVEHRRLHGIPPPKTVPDQATFDRMRDGRRRPDGSQAGVMNVPFEVDGRVYAGIGGGSMMSGIQMEVVMVTDHRRQELVRFQAAVLRDIDARRTAAIDAGREFPEEVVVTLEKDGVTLAAVSDALGVRWSPQS